MYYNKKDDNQETNYFEEVQRDFARYRREYFIRKILMTLGGIAAAVAAFFTFRHFHKKTGA